MEQDQETNAYKGLVSKGEEKNGEVKNRGQRGRLVQWYLEEDGELLSSHLKVFKISGDKKKHQLPVETWEKEILEGRGWLQISQFWSPSRNTQVVCPK